MGQQCPVFQYHTFHMGHIFQLFKRSTFDAPVRIFHWKFPAISHVLPMHGMKGEKLHCLQIYER